MHTYFLFLFFVFTTLFFFFFNDTATTEIYTLSLHDALPISWSVMDLAAAAAPMGLFFGRLANFINAELRSEEHTSELQSRFDLVCRLLLEKKKKSSILRNSKMK